MKRTAGYWNMVKQTFSEIMDDNIFRLSAALSYYTVFSIGPLLLIAIGVAGLVFGEEAARGELSQQMTALFGTSGGEAIEGILSSARSEKGGILATVVGVVVLLFTASGVFAELKSALNEIWEAESRAETGFKGFVRTRLLSFAMVLSIGFLLLVSLIASAVLAAVGKYFGGMLPLPEAVFRVLYSVVSFGLVSLLFAMIFRFLPDIDIEWKDVWVGAVATSFLFTVGKTIIGLYLGHSAVASSFGAAASVALVLLWTYYSSLILFAGAELTQVYTRTFGSRKHEKERLLRPAEGFKPRVVA